MKNLVLSRSLHLIICCVFSVAAYALPNSSDLRNPQQSIQCMQLNHDRKLALDQIQRTAQVKIDLKSKINYLHKIIQKRRDLITQLDKLANQTNNKNYNQLVKQFDELVKERKLAMSAYRQKHRQHKVQRESEERLTQRFTTLCKK